MASRFFRARQTPLSGMALLALIKTGEVVEPTRESEPKALQQWVCPPGGYEQILAKNILFIPNLQKRRDNQTINEPSTTTTDEYVDSIPTSNAPIGRWRLRIVLATPARRMVSASAADFQTAVWRRTKPSSKPAPLSYHPTTQLSNTPRLDTTRNTAAGIARVDVLLSWVWGSPARGVRCVRHERRLESKNTTSVCTVFPLFVWSGLPCAAY